MKTRCHFPELDKVLFLLCIVCALGFASVQGSEGLLMPDKLVEEEENMSGGRIIKMKPHVPISHASGDSETQQDSWSDRTGQLFHYISDSSYWAYSGLNDYYEYYRWGDNPYGKRPDKTITSNDLSEVDTLICYVGRNSTILKNLYKDEENLIFLGNRLSDWDSSKTLVRVTDTEMARLGLETLQSARSSEQSDDSFHQVNESVRQNAGASLHNRSWCFATTDAGSAKGLVNILKDHGLFDQGHGTTWITAGDNHVIHSGTGRVIAYAPVPGNPLEDHREAGKLVLELEQAYIREIFLVDANGGVLGVAPASLQSYVEKRTGNVHLMNLDQLLAGYHSQLYDLTTSMSGKAAGIGAMTAAFAMGGWITSAGYIGCAAFGGALGAAATPFASYLLDKDVYEATSAFWIPFVTLENLTVRSLRILSTLTQWGADGMEAVGQRVTTATGYPVFSMLSAAAVVGAYKGLPFMNAVTGGIAGKVVVGTGVTLGVGAVVGVGAVYFLMSTDTPGVSTVSKAWEYMNSGNK
ncbi:hypothetical protein [Parendozoicomonas sp. Alg238-R29]|uniref:hypothetical protein n=1 Tax=Parendozoicomonas sp. Alg238-R29 TaxID=2993446 RepID=UPI00248D5455|nr:hypothetical protein [Parendozoicomonas sp. Alg238-R29]